MKPELELERDDRVLERVDDDAGDLCVRLMTCDTCGRALFRVDYTKSPPAIQDVDEETPAIAPIQMTIGHLWVSTCSLGCTFAWLARAPNGLLRGYRIF